MLNIAPVSRDENRSSGKRAGSIVTTLSVGVMSVLGMSSEVNAQQAPCPLKIAPDVRDGEWLQKSYDNHRRECMANYNRQEHLEKAYGITFPPDKSIRTATETIRHSEGGPIFYISSAVTSFFYDTDKDEMTLLYGDNNFVTFTFPSGIVVAQSY